VNGSPAAARSFGLQDCGTLEAGASREWLVCDGLGGYAMGTVAGLRTRRYHALLVVASTNGAARNVGLAALDAVVVIGDRRFRLATNEWAGGAIDPRGYELLSRFDLIDGVPRWTWRVGGTVVQREVAMDHGSPTVAVTHRIVAASDAVRLEVTPLCTWRDAHGERQANGEPALDAVANGFVFESRYRVCSAAVWQPGGAWYVNAYLREEANRGLSATEDLWAAGTFSATLNAGESLDVVASADLTRRLPISGDVVTRSRQRATALTVTAKSADDTDAQLVLAADQFVVTGGGSPSVVAGYPWFGAWSRDTMTSYEGLFLTTGRADEGRALLAAAAGTLSEGMLANTADTGTLEYNTADGTLWFLHAVCRHVAVTGDVDLAAQLSEALTGIIDYHVSGTRYGIVVDPADGLLCQGADGLALTWMDARVDGRPVTARAGKAVDINALWINGIRSVSAIQRQIGGSTVRLDALATDATRSFNARFVRPDGLGLYDVVDGPLGADAAIRPNQLLALSLPFGPGAPTSAFDVCRDHLLTPLGMRSLSGHDPAYRGAHRGDSRARDAAYHQGTVWPWLIGPFADAARRTGHPGSGLFDGLDLHLGEWGLGSVSETTDGDAPHGATGCPFQAWSVAETLRGRRLA
jgi:predicted glycogen debranching enzyme